MATTLSAGRRIRTPPTFSATVLSSNRPASQVIKICHQPLRGHRLGLLCAVAVIGAVQVGEDVAVHRRGHQRGGFQVSAAWRPVSFGQGYPLALLVMPSTPDEHTTDCKSFVLPIGPPP